MEWPSSLFDLRRLYLIFLFLPFLLVCVLLSDYGSLQSRSTKIDFWKWIYANSSANSVLASKNLKSLQILAGTVAISVPAFLIFFPFLLVYFCPFPGQNKDVLNDRFLFIPSLRSLPFPFLHLESKEKTSCYCYLPQRGGVGLISKHSPLFFAGGHSHSLHRRRGSGCWPFSVSIFHFS